MSTAVSTFVASFALSINNVTKKKKEGASTITQQVAKNSLLTSEQSYLRKAKEAILAIRIERAYTKEHILDLYLNPRSISDRRSYGVAAAGLRYFRQGAS